MSEIIVYKSNRLENLTQKYHELVSENPTLPLTTEPVIVQSIGMGRWFSLYLAEKSGVWANFKYLFSNTL